MERDLEAPFIAACCTIGCAWELACPTEYQALLASRKHEEEKEFHMTVVMPPELNRKAA